MSARARESFARSFGEVPEACARAPGRVNLIGEHTDYNDGFVLPIAIDLDCVCACGPGRGTVHLASADVGAAYEAPPGEALRAETWRTAGAPRWASYAAVALACAAREAPALESMLRTRGIRLAVASDVPLGGGLSSSAALEVSVALAACALAGEAPADIARACQRAEHEFAGTPCGLMDQFVSVHARAGHALLLDCATGAFEHVPMPPGWSVMVLDTGVRHELAGGEYARRRASCERAARALGAPSLRHARERDLGAPGLAPQDRDRARHVIREIERARTGAGALARGDARVFGALMVQSHASLRDDYEVSCPELNIAVEVLLDVPGVVGARMTGGGFGGAAIGLVRTDDAPSAAPSAAEAYARRTGRDGKVRVVRASGGASAETAPAGCA